MALMHRQPFRSGAGRSDVGGIPDNGFVLPTAYRQMNALAVRRDVTHYPGTWVRDPGCDAACAKDLGGRTREPCHRTCSGGPAARRP